MNLKTVKDALKSPQAAMSFLATIVSVLGTVGIINTDLSGAIQTVLTAVLGLIVVLTHSTVSAKSVAKQLTVTRDNPDAQ